MIMINKEPSKSMDDYVEERLVEWANWYRRDFDGGICYPKRSIIKMIMDGEVIKKKKRRAKKPLPNHERAEEIERYICEMYRHKAIMADVLRSHYLYHLDIRSNAKKLGLSYASFYRYVQMGKQWIVGELSV